MQIKGVSRVTPPPEAMGDGPFHAFPPAPLLVTTVLQSLPSFSLCLLLCVSILIRFGVHLDNLGLSP